MNAVVDIKRKTFSSLKYLLIACINAAILTVLLTLWTDPLEMRINTFVRPIEFLKIIGLTLLSLVGMRIVVSILNKKTFSDLPKRKIAYSIVVTVAISAYLYLDYASNVYSRFFDESRHSLLEKIEDLKMLTYGTKADNLTFKEYSLLADITWFPELPKSADKISYLYTYDGFFPDYTFRLNYRVPADTDIEQIDYENEGISKRQSFVVAGGRKNVTYEEGKW